MRGAVTTIEGPASRQAQLTFAMARHALIDLGHVFQIEGDEAEWLASGRTGRLSPEVFDRLCEALSRRLKGRHLARRS